MDPARISKLLAPFLNSPARHSEPAQNGGEACPEPSRREPAFLSPAQLQHISIYIDLLLRWNARMNLTAIRDPEEIVTRHFGESLFAARHLFPDGAADANARITVADLGSGAGFPGIPIKLWAPAISLTLIESNHKKSTFLREVARTLTLTDIDIQTTRAQDLLNPPASSPSKPNCFDVVTLRAVERFEEILPTAASLVAPNGRLALLISAHQLPTTKTAPTVMRWAQPVPIPLSNSRILVVGENQN
jgi:16S rRNA (guanine527-N7)-methyltransferase